MSGLGATNLAKAELENIIKCKGNESCADCGTKNPRWASINLGLLMCIDCSGHHRNLGVHISVVKSLTLDKWKPEWIRVLKSIGNALAVAYYEYQIPASYTKPTSGDTPDVIENWIRNKYEHLRFAPKHGVAPHKLLAEGKNPWTAIPGHGEQEEQINLLEDVKPAKATSKKKAQRQQRSPTFSFGAQEDANAMLDFNKMDELLFDTTVQQQSSSSVPAPQSSFNDALGNLTHQNNVALNNAAPNFMDVQNIGNWITSMPQSNQHSAINASGWMEPQFPFTTGLTALPSQNDMLQQNMDIQQPFTSFVPSSSFLQSPQYSSAFPNASLGGSSLYPDLSEAELREIKIKRARESIARFFGQAKEFGFGIPAYPPIIPDKLDHGAKNFVFPSLAKVDAPRGGSKMDDLLGPPRIMQRNGVESSALHSINGPTNSHRFDSMIREDLTAMPSALNIESLNRSEGETKEKTEDALNNLDAFVLTTDMAQTANKA